jgi:hypothetical protein
MVPPQLNQLATSLKGIAPSQNETTQLITYTLIAVAITGIFVYHYIKQQENKFSSNEKEVSVKQGTN